MQIIQGNTASLTLLVQDADGVPVDLTAALVGFTLWLKGAQAAALELTEASGGVSRGADGVLDIFLADTETALQLGEYIQEVRVTADYGAPALTYRVSKIDQVTVVDSTYVNGLGQ